jgi:predicted ATPase/DNA-binding CsgD family transcriptional regulator
MDEYGPLYEPLTERERQMLMRLAQGRSDQQIADELYLSPNTVRWYNRQLYAKLGVGSRTQAVARAKALGLLRNDSTAPTPTDRPAPPHDLPAAATPLIGREREIADLTRLLESSRLLTLTGVGGTGKTRLALHVAELMRGQFADGVFFVDLAPVDDLSHVPARIAAVLDIAENTREPLSDTLTRALAGREILLVIDNFEHVIAAAPLVSQLLAAAPRLKMLATSREPLKLSGEQEYPVPPLSLPSGEQPTLEAVAASEAGALFIQRVRMIQPRIVLNDDSAAAIAEICARLDGLPLAIELAAARCNLLPPQALLARLDSRLALLTAGPRDAPQRQRTLRAAIAWSYNLLNEAEKTLFARLAVFRGGFALDAIEAVCAHDPPPDLIDDLASLVDKNLIGLAAPTDKDLFGWHAIPSGGPRFAMLQTLREFAWEQLEASGELETMRRQHAEFFAALAERAESELRMAPHVHWFQRFELESGNLRDALAWSLDHGSVETGVRLAGAIWLFWFAYGHHAEGLRWTQRLLARLDEVPESLYPKLLIAAGNMAMTGDPDAARPLFSRALDTARRLNDTLQAAWALTHLASCTPEPETANRHVRRALARFRELDCLPGTAHALNVLGEIARATGDDAMAQGAYETCLEICLKTGEWRRVAIMEFNLAFLAQHRGDHQAAISGTKEAINTALRMGNRGEVAWGLPIVAGSLSALGQPEHAARLLGTSDAFLEHLGTYIMPADKQEFDRIRAEVSALLGDAAFEAAYAEGRRATLEQALASI